MLRRLFSRPDASRPGVPALFFHLQKTAGTSVVDLARRHYGSRGVVRHGDFLDRSPEDFADTPFVSGHFGFDYASPLLPGRYSFTFLRDPLDRLVSKYFHCRTTPVRYPIHQRARALDFDDFLEAGLTGKDLLIRSHVWNYQVWQLAHGHGRSSRVPAPGEKAPWDFGEEELLDLALSHAGQLSQVGFVERFDEDCEKVFATLGFSHTPGKRSNVTRSRPRTGELPARTRDLLLGLTELDRRLYTELWSART